MENNSEANVEHRWSTHMFQMKKWISREEDSIRLEWPFIGLQKPGHFLEY